MYISVPQMLQSFRIDDRGRSVPSKHDFHAVNVLSA